MASWEMNAKVGQYFYAPHYRCTGVWQIDYKSENCQSGRFIKDFATKEEAKAFVYQMNGWTKAAV